jgi:hypothetical protein
MPAIWEIKFWYYAGPVITLYGKITSSYYVNTLGDHAHPVVRMLPNDVIFHMTIRPYT